MQCSHGDNDAARGLTWNAARAQAQFSGGRLPTIDDLKRADASALLEQRDVWLPVRRADGIEGDWCGPNNEGKSTYRSHLDRHRNFPDWGADGGGHGHIPGTHGGQFPFFFVARSEAEVAEPTDTAESLRGGGHVNREQLAAIREGDKPPLAGPPEIQVCPSGV